MKMQNKTPRSTAKATQMTQQILQALLEDPQHLAAAVRRVVPKDQWARIAKTVAQADRQWQETFAAQPFAVVPIKEDTDNDCTNNVGHNRRTPPRNNLSDQPHQQ